MEEIKKEVIYSDNPSRLFELTVELTEEISKQHIELAGAEDSQGKAKIRGKISLLTALQNIIDKRIDEVRAQEKENERKEALANKHFKIAAKTVLTRESYDKIKELSLMPHKKFKEQKAELEAGKLE